jgi:hypothetical protein
MRYPVDYHAMAADFCEYACNGMVGRGELDPVYQAVTEGRDIGAMQKSYSSCGDLAHSLYYRLGVRLPWVNRAEHGGHRASQTENNVTLLQRFKPRLINPKSETRYAPGDVGIIWNTGYDAHVFVILEDRQPKELLVAEYGQPGGHIKERPVTYRNNLLFIGSRALHCVLRLDDVLDVADRENLLAGPESAAMWAQRLGLPHTPNSTDPTEDDPPLS